MNQNWNNNKCRCECKNPKEHQCEKSNFRNPAKCSYRNGKYAVSIGNSVVICDEIIEDAKSTSTKTIPTKKYCNKNCTLTNFCILLSFLLITIASLRAISI